MAGVSATLEFDAQSAFDAVDQIDAAFAGVAQDFGVQLAQAIEAVSGTPIEPEVDGAAVTSQVDEALLAANGEVTVDADTSSLSGDVDTALADSGTTVEIDGDTSGLQSAVSEAQASVDDLAASSAAASGGLGDLSGAASGVGAAAGLAQGDVSGLSGAVGGLSAGAAAGVGALVAVGGAATSFFGSAVEAAGAAERFNLVLGSSASAVQNVDVGGLNTDLGELAITAGTSDEAMLNATTRVFGIGQAMGEARPQLESTTETLAAVATNASLLNPALGDAATATGALFNAASAGRQRSLQQFGINLNKTQIDALAVEQGLAATTEEVTAFDRATVIANVALQQTPDLLASITAGASNTEVTVGSLRERFGELLETAGEPLLGAGIESMEAALPAVEALSSSIGTLAGGALPVLVGALQAVAVPLQIVATIIEAVPSPFIAAGAAFLIAARVLPLVATGLQLVWARAAAAIVPTSALTLGTTQLAAAQTAASASSIGLTGALGLVAAVGVGGFMILRNYIESVGEIGPNAADAASESTQLVNALSETGSVAGAVAEDLRGAAQANGSLNDALTLSGVSAAEFANVLATTDPANLGAQISEMASAVQAAGGDFSDAQFALADYASLQQDAAQAAIDAAVANGTVSESAAEQAIATAEATAGTGNYLAALGLLPGVAQQTEQAIQAMTEAVQANVPTLAEAIQNVDRAGESFGVLNASTDPQLVIDNLAQMVSAFANFTENIGTIGETSSLVATTLAELGPDVAGPFVAALAQAPPAMTEQLDFVLQIAQARGVSLQSILTGFTANGIAGATSALEGAAGEFDAAGQAAGTAGGTGVEQGLAGVDAAAATAGTTAATSFGDSLNLVQALAAGSMAVAGAAIVGAMPVGAATAAGTVTATAFGSALSSGAASGAATAMAVAASVIAGSAPYGTAISAGNAVGVNFGSSIAGGIRSQISAIASAAASAVNEAEAAARAAADSNSPSRVFMAIGADLGEGMAIGIAGQTAALAGAATSTVDAAVSAARAQLAATGGLALATSTTGTTAGDGVGGAVFGPGSIVISVSGPVTPRDVRDIERATETGVAAALERKRVRSELAAGRS